MAFFRKKPIVVEAITFDELVAYGLEVCGSTFNIVNGMPWSFDYKGHPITHETDTCYLIPTLEGTMHFTPDDMLITGVKGEIYPCKKDIFEASYDSELSVVRQQYFLSSDDAGDRYVIPVEKREEWFTWMVLPEDDPDSWEAPEFAKRIGTRAFTFQSPTYNGKPLF